MISNDPDEFAQAPAAVGDMVGYLSQLVAAKRARPRDDLISEFTIAGDGDNGFTEVEILAIVFALLVAGYETSSTSSATAPWHCSSTPRSLPSCAASRPSSGRPSRR